MKKLSFWLGAIIPFIIYTALEYHLISSEGYLEGKLDLSTKFIIIVFFIVNLVGSYMGGLAAIGKFKIFK